MMREERMMTTRLERGQNDDDERGERMMT